MPQCGPVKTANRRRMPLLFVEDGNDDRIDRVCKNELGEDLGKGPVPVAHRGVLLKRFAAVKIQASALKDRVSDAVPGKGDG